MKDAVIIISGGMDSTTMLYEFKDEIALAITFDYGSTQNGRERICAITRPWCLSEMALCWPSRRVLQRATA